MKSKSKSSLEAPSKKLTTPQLVTAIFSYLGILVFIPLLLYDKRDDFMRFHLRQGLAFFAVELLLMLITWMLWLLEPLTHVLQIIVFIAALIALVKAVLGQKWNVPYLHHVIKYIPPLK